MVLRGKLFRKLEEYKRERKLLSAEEKAFNKELKRLQPDIKKRRIEMAKARARKQAMMIDTKPKEKLLKRVFGTIKEDLAVVKELRADFKKSRRKKGL